MEGTAALATSSSPTPRTHFSSTLLPPSPATFRQTQVIRFHPRLSKCRHLVLLPPPSASAVVEAVDAELEKPDVQKEVSKRIDKTGRFCTPRAARELALLISYAACLEGSDPVRLFHRRVNARRIPGYVFDKATLLDYDHMSFSGSPVKTGTEEEAEELMLKNEKESTIEAEVLSAPLKLVYNKFVLSLTRDILEAVVERWNEHVRIIDTIIPISWKDEPAARILELCILHLAMAEIVRIGTRHQIVINEAVDLAKRFCDGCAPRVINGCLRTFVKDHNSPGNFQP